ncbi:MFS transporter [Streptomyces sp. NPDC057623]|uniref:MFS transporter n=1 Tax=Streptomyces sp. NPDC057623 TaxID=3346187 RepID=UPI003693A1CA
MAVDDAHNVDHIHSELRADRLVQRMERVPVTHFHHRLVATLGAGTFFDAFDIVSIAVVLTAISHTFDLTSSQAGLLVSAGFLGQALGALGFGLVSERWGRRKVFLAALVVMGVFALISVASWNSESLGIIRFVQGLGLGAEVPVASALLGEFVCARQRGRVTVLYKLASPLGNLATSLTAALLLALTPEEVAWRLLFTIGAAPLLIALIAWRTLPESPRHLLHQGRTEEAEKIVRQMEACAGIGPGAEDTSQHANEAPAAAEREAVPSTRLTELFSPQYRGRTLMMWALWFTVFFTLLGGTAWMPSLYVKVAGVSPAVASLLSGTVTLASVGMIILVGTTVDRVGRKRWFRIGYGMSLTGALIAATLAATGGLTSWPTLLLAGGLMLLGVSAIDPLVYAYTTELYPTRMRAWGALSASAWRGFAAVLAPVITGRLLDAGSGITVVFLVFATVLALGLAVHLRWGIETKQTPLEALAQ